MRKYSSTTQPKVRILKEACGWFVLCKNPATGTTPHPILGMVPTCARCNAFATKV